MNDYEEDDEKTSIEELIRKKAELENEIPNLVERIQEGQRIKARLLEAKKDSKKLIHHREKLKNLKGERLGSSLDEGSGYKKEIEDKSPVYGREEPSRSTTTKENEEHHSTFTAPLVREINALKIENSSLVKEKRKVEEHRDALVQELAALNTKHDKMTSICNRLEAEIHRLSSCVGKSKTQSSEQKEDIEVLKEQLRLYQEDIKSLQGELQATKRSNERLKTELKEAGLVIRDIRGQAPRVQVYPAAICEPVYRTYDDRGYRYTREPLGYAMMRSYSGDCLVPMMRDENLRRGAPIKKPFLTPDLTAEVDNEVIDHSLASSKSI